MFTGEPIRDVQIEKKLAAESNNTPIPQAVNTLDNRNGGLQIQLDDPFNLLIHAATMAEKSNSAATSQVLPSIREVVPPIKAKTMPWMITQGVLPPPFPITNSTVRRSISITELIHPEPRTPKIMAVRIPTNIPINNQINTSINSAISPLPQSPSPSVKAVPTIYTCTHPGCTKHFPSRSRLKRHTAVHGGLKPFKCIHEGCERTFSRRDNMMQHYRMHVTKQRPSSLKITISRPKAAVHSDDETVPADNK